MRLPTVLIADSDPAQQQLIDVLLTPEGYRLAMFHDGAEVLSYLKRHTPNLAILDADLPVINGIDICAKVKGIKRFKDMKVILTSAPARYPTVKSLARAVKADLVLMKPLGDKQLRRQVNRLMAAVPQERQLATPTPVDESNARAAAAPQRTPANALTVTPLPSDPRRELVSTSVSGRLVLEPDQVPLLLEELHRLRSQLAQLTQENARLKTAQAAHAALQTRAAALDHDLDQLRQELAAARQFKDESERLRRELSQLSAENATLRAELLAQSEASTPLESLVAMVNVQAKQLELLRRHNQQLLRSLHALQDDRGSLRRLRSKKR
jgi:DNA-binding response OmpR family regulator